MRTRTERTRIVTPRLRGLAGPASALLLLGLWVFFVPLVGPYFDFGFHTDATWSFSERHWMLSLAPGLAAAAAALAMLAPSAVAAWLGGLGAALAGIWLLVGPSLYPVWSAGDIEPGSASDTMSALLWIGYYFGTGALVVYLAALAQGVLRRPVPAAGEDEPARPLADVEPEPRRPVGIL